MADLADLWPDNYKRRPARALPVTLIVDVGEQFPEARAAELKNGISQFDLFIQQHEELRNSIDVTLFAPRWGMADVQLEVIRREPTYALERDLKFNLFSTIDGVLDDFEQRSASQTTGAPSISSHWLVLMSEGGNHADVRWARRVDEQTRNGRLTVIPVIVGEGSDNALLMAMGRDRPPLRLQRCGGQRFFFWLGKELQRVVTAKPGKRVHLDVAGMATWAQI